MFDYPNISVYTLEYTVSPKKRVGLLYWVGALLRNNFLYAASSIHMEGDTSLLQLIQRTENLMPRGYAFQCDPIFDSVTLDGKDELHFRLLLFGNYSKYAKYFHEAVLSMCNRGIGTPITPLSILSCRHYRTDSPDCGFASGRFLKLSFITPVSIYNGRAKPLHKRTTLDMQNGMPGLYFFIRSIARRINKLQAVYEGGTLWAEEQADEWCMEARKAQVEECVVKRIVLEGPPRRQAERPIYFKGYIGYSIYSDVDAKYFPILMKGMETNVGNDTVYGMGEYRISDI